jgi:hypothetical protein
VRFHRRNVRQLRANPVPAHGRDVEAVRQKVDVMQDGAHLIAVLWESAWAAGDGEKNMSSTRALGEGEAMKICAGDKSVPSVTIDKIGPFLR